LLNLFKELNPEVVFDELGELPVEENEKTHLTNFIAAYKNDKNNYRRNCYVRKHLLQLDTDPIYNAELTKELNSLSDDEIKVINENLKNAGLYEGEAINKETP